MKAKNFNVGVVGGGRATMELTLPVLSNIPNIKVVGVCDIDQSVANLLSTNFKASAYTSLEEMIDREKLDAVIINTPVKTHAELAIKAMKKGVHVFLEKPAVASVSELDDIFNVSLETGSKLTVAHNYKFHDGVRMAEKIYKDGIIGEVLHVDRIWMSPPHKDRMEMDKDGWWHKMPGGRLADALPHMLYIPFMFVGPMKLVSVSARKMSNRSWSVCDESDILLATSKAYVNIRQSLNQESWPYKGYTYHTIVYGTKRNMIIDAFGASIIEGQTRKQKIKEFFNSIKRNFTSQEKSIRGAHNIIYREFFDYLRGDRPNPTPEDEVRNVVELTVRIAEKMQESVDTSLPVLAK